jgi:hypothetical protein
VAHHGEHRKYRARAEQEERVDAGASLRSAGRLLGGDAARDGATPKVEADEARSVVLSFGR